MHVVGGRIHRALQPFGKILMVSPLTAEQPEAALIAAEFP